MFLLQIGAAAWRVALVVWGLETSVVGVQAEEFALTFAYTDGISVPSLGIATPYPSTIAASGVTGRAVALRLKLNDLHNCRPEDLNIILVVPNGHLDTKTPPSQAPDRQEVVALILEDHSRCGTCLLPIMRNDFEGFPYWATAAVVYPDFRKVIFRNILTDATIHGRSLESSSKINNSEDVFSTC